MKRWGIVAATTAALSIAGGTAYYVWRSADRPPLAVLDHSSQAYLVRHGQNWLSPPSAASNSCRWKMTESSGNIIDDLCGLVVLTANGSPTYEAYTPIPTSAGFNRKAIIFKGSEWFAAGDNSVLDQITNDFSTQFWFCVNVAPAADAYLISKRTGNNGYSVFLDSSVRLNIEIGDGVLASGLVSAALPFGCHDVAVKWNRASTATADIDGIATGVTVDISARSGSVTSAVPFTIGRLASGGNAFIGRVAEVMVSNGTVTTAEHLARYKAFRTPITLEHEVLSTPSYAQTTTWKWPAPADSKGAHLNITSGSASNPQWPSAYSAAAVASDSNPLGLGFPRHQAVTNVIGRTNEFGSWTAAGAAPPVVTADQYEGPDGSLICDKAQFGNGASTLTKTVVGGGNIAAGELWGASIYYKYISGTACDIRMYNGTTAYTTLGTGATWSKAWVLGRTAAEAKQIQFSRNAGTDCIYALCEAQYTQNGVYDGICTSTTGDVSQTCNASYYQQSIANSALAYLPNSIERLEVQADVSTGPTGSQATYGATSKQVIWTLGNVAEMTAGIRPTFAVKNSGGGIEYLSKAKPVGVSEQRRVYRAGWNTQDGLTNTNPRRYGSLRVGINGGVLEHQKAIMESRTATEIDEPTQRDLNCGTLTVGCNASGANCSNGVLASLAVYARPAQQEHADEADEAYIANFEGSSWLQNAAVVDLCDYTFDVAAADRWCWNMAEYSGSIYDQWNGVALTPTGSPVYQIPSGLLARGQGRRGINFDRANAEYVRAAANSVASISGDAVTLEYIAFHKTLANFEGLGSSVLAGTAGYGTMVSAAGFLSCVVSDGVDRRRALTAAGGLEAGKFVYVACTAQKSGGNWEATIYVDGLDATNSRDGATPTGSIANGAPFTVGSTGAGAYHHDGQIYEVRVSNTEHSAAEILSTYQQIVQGGLYLSSTGADIVAHYKLNETAVTNGVGLLDMSGNGNHLTIVNATPDPQYKDMPWPAGSGTARPAISYTTGNKHSIASSGDLTPSHQQPYSILAIYRGDGANNWVVHKSYGAQGYLLWVGAGGVPTFNWVTPDGTTSRAWTSTVTDDNWHLLAGKAWWESSKWYIGISVDGGAFLTATNNKTGDPSTASAINFAQATTSVYQQLGGVSVLKNYALTDANIASLWEHIKGPLGDDHTYTRTATGSKGICYDVAVDPIAGMRVKCFANNEVPYAYNSNLSQQGNGRLLLSFPIHAGGQNLLVGSESFNTWTPQRASVAANSVVAPDGTLTADTLIEDNTPANTHFIFRSPVVAVASYATSVYARKGSRWGIALAGDTFVHGAYFNLATCTAGTTWGGATATTEGAGNGWCRCTMVANNTVAAARSWYIFLAEADNDITFNGDPITYPAGAYLWGAHLQQTSKWQRFYCPTTGVTQTCNAPTASYVATANLTGWDRVEGIISTTIWPGVTTGYAWDIHNGVDLNGAIRHLSPATEVYAYNSTGVLQQRWSQANSQINVPIGTVIVYDSQETVTGTRRAWGTTYASTYAGPWLTYTTDTAANWTHGGGTNLNIGSATGGATPIDGYISEVAIYGAR